ncbi:MAG: 4Fe-4S binding protein [Spirochaetes bacterium]|nr:4Fe-4S binding protein [Spirochaetota bacterium]
MAKAILTISEADCKGCLMCADACPKKILELDKSRVNAKGYNHIACVNLEECTACAICARTCPDSVIKVERRD